MLRWLRNVYRFLVTAVCVCVVALFVWAGNLCKFKDIDGKRTFYVYSKSSQALAVENLRFEHLFSVQGESVRFALGDKAGSEVVAEIFARYQGAVCIEEEVDGVKSYYGYAPALGEYVAVGGQAVNLHVAIRGGECVVGSPIIFGGF